MKSFWKLELSTLQLHKISIHLLSILSKFHMWFIVSWQLSSLFSKLFLFLFLWHQWLRSSIWRNLTMTRIRRVKMNKRSPSVGRCCKTSIISACYLSVLYHKRNIFIYFLGFFFNLSVIDLLCPVGFNRNFSKLYYFLKVQF